MQKDTLRQILVILSLIATVAVNALANIIPFNNLNTGQISDSFQVFFVPAGYVFTIWSLIYLGLGAYAIYQALPSQRGNPRLRSIGWLFVVNAVANSAWMFLWHYLQFPLTFVVMVIILLTLIAIHQRLGTGRTKVPAAETWLVRVPFSIYLGWISVATIANATSLLDYWSWSGWGIAPEVWAVIMLAAAVIIALLMSLTRGDVAYLLVFVWAFIGIAVKQSGTPLVAISAWVAAGLVGILVVVAILTQQRRALPPAAA